MPSSNPFSNVTDSFPHNNNQSFHLNYRQMNKMRLANFGPKRELLLKVPEEGPGCYFKKFSSCGRYVFAFGGDSRFVIYPVNYKGTIEEELSTSFSDFFCTEAIEIDVASGLRNFPGCPEIASSLLCRDFCLDLGNGLIILAASSPSECYEVDDRPPCSYLIRSDGKFKRILNDSHTAFPCLDHVTFFLVDLKTKKVVDFLHFKYEFIYLAHHLGVGLLSKGEDNWDFSILSVKNQRIFLFEVTPTEGFTEKTVVARNSIEELELEEEEAAEIIVDSVPSGAKTDVSWGRPDNGMTVTPLPYSILSILHIWKHQLLRDNKILLRLTPAHLILATNPRHQSMVHALDPLPSIHKNSYLVLFDYVKDEVVSVVNSADEGVFEWIEGNWKYLRGAACSDDDFDLLKLSMERSSGAGSTRNSLMRRFTNIIPQSPQQLCTSPWLDSSILRWDPKITPTLSRLTPISQNYFNGERILGATGLYDCNYESRRVKFFSRSSNSLSHTLNLVDEDPHTETSTDSNGMDRHKWINVLMHPTLPLIMIYQYGIFRSISIRIFYN